MPQKRRLNVTNKLLNLVDLSFVPAPVQDPEVLGAGIISESSSDTGTSGDYIEC